MHKLASPLAIKALSETTGEIEGYGSVFDVVDSYDEVVKRGAFEKSLTKARETGRLPAMLWQHRMDEPIGVWTDMREDEQGLYVRGRLLIDADPLAQRALAHLKNGSVTGLSIGYSAMTFAGNVRDIIDLDLKEVSLVTIPANDAARVTAVKAFAEAGTIREIEELLRDVQHPKQAERKAIISAIKRAIRREAEAEIAEQALQESLQRLQNLFRSN